MQGKREHGQEKSRAVAKVQFRPKAKYEGLMSDFGSWFNLNLKVGLRFTVASTSSRLVPGSFRSLIWGRGWINSASTSVHPEVRDIFDLFF